MARLLRWCILVLLTVIVVLPKLRGQQSVDEDIAYLREKQAQRLRESELVTKELLAGKSSIPRNLVEDGKCIIIIPSVKKVAYVLGFSYGRGTMSCRLGEDFRGPWSAPSMVALEGGTVGLQLGVQATDLVFLVLNERGVESLLRNKIRLGADVTVAAGPVGRSVEGATDLGMRAEILSYSHSGGLFAGVSVGGSTLRPDNAANDILYHRQISASQIVRNARTPVPAAGRRLVTLLNVTTEGDAARAQE